LKKDSLIQLGGEHSWFPYSLYLIGFALSAVDRLHVQGVAWDEGDVLHLAQIGQPAPAK
jgi:hypothetical protein